MRLCMLLAMAFSLAAACPAGSFPTNTACQLCAADTFSSAGTQCTPCPLGTTAAAGATACGIRCGYYDGGACPPNAYCPDFY
jgi:hypothetical protein